jgi:hypothetical protein
MSVPSKLDMLERTFKKMTDQEISFHFVSSPFSLKSVLSGFTEFLTGLKMKDGR